MEKRTKSLLIVLLACQYTYADLQQATPSQISGQALQESLKSESPNVETTKPNLNAFDQAFAEYVKEQYNKENYANHMSQSVNDFITLLEAVKEADIGENRLFKAYTIFKLWNDKLKSVEMVDDSIMIQMLQAIPLLTKGYLKLEYKTSIEEIKGNIEHQLQCNLLEQFDTFIEQPEQALSNVSLALAQQQKSILNRIEDINKLKNMITRFCEGTLSKVIWNIKNPNEIWDSVKLISKGINGLLHNHAIGDEDELDGLHWSLVHRFCFFLDLRGALMPLEFYNKVEQQLASNEVSFLEEEQDDFITTKKETFARSLIKAKIKAMAYYNNGIISDEVL